MKTQEDLSSDRPSNLFYESTGIQKIAGYAAILCAIAAVGMTITWADKHDTDENYLGGLNWSKRVFNWHPVLMVSGMILCLVCSLLTYRIIQLPKMVTKLFHALFHSAAIVCILTGLAAVTTSHNYTDHNKNGTYTANLYSMHSLLGISAMVVYFSNYLMGFIHFLVPGVSLEMKQAFKPNHIFLGVFTLIVGAIAVESGITELTTKLGCIYKVGNADWDPALNYHHLTDGCKLANGIGIVVLLSVFLCAYAILGPGVSAFGGSEATDSIQSKLHP